MRPARHDPLLSGLNPAAAAFEFAVVWLTMAGFALTAIPAEIASPSPVAPCEALRVQP